MSDHLSQQPPHRFKTYESFIAWLTVTEKAEKTGDVKLTNKRRTSSVFGKGVRVPGTAPGELGYQLEGPATEAFLEVGRTEHVKVYRGRRYPSFDPAESQAKRKGKKSQRKARKSENAEPCGAGPQRSSSAAVRSEPYPTQRGRSLPSSTIHTSTSLPTAGPSTSVGAYTTPVAVCPPAFHPTMHGPSPSSSVAPSSSFAFPPSFYSSSTLPSSAPLPPSSFFAPPPSWMPSQQHTLPSSASALPFPLTSHVPATALAAGPTTFPPPQTQHQALHGRHPYASFPILRLSSPSRYIPLRHVDSRRSTMSVTHRPRDALGTPAGHAGHPRTKPDSARAHKRNDSKRGPTPAMPPRKNLHPRPIFSETGP
ncbi:hypothetical protein LXA43DRAFT_210358 [Ganoderma leucocontextum]|nr:hypothetical protein LXA43DRAFT_210358 [Ganoderma leucocontextum]